LDGCTAAGFFYTFEKQKSLGVAQEQVAGFRWEALMTWVARVILLVLCITRKTDSSTRMLPTFETSGHCTIRSGAMAAGWIIYDFAVR